MNFLLNLIICNANSIISSNHESFSISKNFWIQNATQVIRELESLIFSKILLCHALLVFIMIKKRKGRFILWKKSDFRNFQNWFYDFTICHIIEFSFYEANSNKNSIDNILKSFWKLTLVNKNIVHSFDPKFFQSHIKNVT